MTSLHPATFKPTIQSRANAVLAATEFDKIRSSAIIPADTASKKTMQNNVVNGLLYGLNAFVPFSGAIINPIACAVKFGFAMFASALSLGAKGEAQDGYMKLSADLMKSGAENLVVGAASCIPGAGQYIAGAMAVRSFVDAKRA